MNGLEVSRRQRVVSSAFWLLISIVFLVIGALFAHDLGVNSVQSLTCGSLFLVCLVTAFLMPARLRVALLVRLRLPSGR